MARGDFWEDTEAMAESDAGLIDTGAACESRSLESATDMLCKESAIRAVLEVQRLFKEDECTVIRRSSKLLAMYLLG